MPRTTVVHKQKLHVHPHLELLCCKSLFFVPGCPVHGHFCGHMEGAAEAGGKFGSDNFFYENYFALIPPFVDRKQTRGFPRCCILNYYYIFQKKTNVQFDYNKYGTISLPL